MNSYFARADVAVLCWLEAHAVMHVGNGIDASKTIPEF
jgi:hypothetical protein